jgi:hypothetical protein
MIFFLAVAGAVWLGSIAIFVVLLIIAAVTGVRQ